MQAQRSVQETQGSMLLVIRGHIRDFAIAHHHAQGLPVHVGMARAPFQPVRDIRAICPDKVKNLAAGRFAPGAGFPLPEWDSLERSALLPAFWRSIA